MNVIMMMILIQPFSSFWIAFTEFGHALDVLYTSVFVLASYFHFFLNFGYV